MTVREQIRKQCSDDTIISMDWHSHADEKCIKLVYVGKYRGTHAAEARYIATCTEIVRTWDYKGFRSLPYVESGGEQRWYILRLPEIVNEFHRKFAEWESSVGLFIKSKDV